MPAIAAVIGSVFSALGSIGGALGGLFSGVFGGILKSVLMTGLSSLLGKSNQSYGIEAGNRTLTIKQDITTRQVVYGRVFVSGPLVYFDAHGGDTRGGTNENNHLHIVIPLASHECHEVEYVFFDNDPVATNSDRLARCSGPGQGIWNSAESAIYVTDPGSKLLEDLAVSDSVRIDECLVVGSTGISQAIKNSTVVEVVNSTDFTVFESEFEILNLAVSDNIGLRLNNLEIDASAVITNISDGLITIQCSDTSALSDDDSITGYISGTAFGTINATRNIASVDIDAGKIVLTAGGFKNNCLVQIERHNGDRVEGAEYDEKVWLDVYHGRTDQTVNSDMKADIPGWSDNHTLTGVCYVHAELQYGDTEFSKGAPQVGAIVKGKKVYDPRNGWTRWTDNPALCIRDFLLDPKVGLGKYFTSADLDDDSFETAANVCDESVSLKGGGTEKRYTCNGNIDHGAKPSQILGEMLSSMAGMMSITGGRVKIYAGAYITPTLTLTEDDLVSNVKVEFKVGRREIFNTVKGLFVYEKSRWQRTDYPAVTNATYVSDDGGNELVKTYNLGFTTSYTMAQRIAKIELERARRQITVEGTFRMNAFKLVAGDTVKLTLSKFDWTEKVFEVRDWQYLGEEATGDDGTVSALVKLTLKETDSSVYSWTPSTDEQDFVR